MRRNSRALVVSVTKARMILLTESGQFITVARRPGASVGDRICLNVRQNLTSRRFLAAAIFVALALVVSINLLPLHAPVFAYVSVDINPSLELALNRAGHVRSVRAMNEGGSLVQQHSDLAGLDLEVAIGRLIDTAVSLELCGREPTVLIAVILTAQSGRGLDDFLDTTGLIKAAESGVDHATCECRVTHIVIMSSTDQRREAKRVGLSAGRYVTMVAANDAGYNVGPDVLAGSGWEQAIGVSLDQLLTSLSGENRLAGLERANTSGDEQRPRTPFTLHDLARANGSGAPTGVHHDVWPWLAELWTELLEVHMAHNLEPSVGPQDASEPNLTVESQEIRPVRPVLSPVPAQEESGDASPASDRSDESSQSESGSGPAVILDEPGDSELPGVDPGELMPLPPCLNGTIPGGNAVDLYPADTAPAYPEHLPGDPGEGSESIPDFAREQVKEEVLRLPSPPLETNISPPEGDGSEPDASSGSRGAAP